MLNAAKDANVELYRTTGYTQTLFRASFPTDPRPTTAPCPPHRQRGVRDNGPVFFCGAHPEASRLFIAPWVELRGIGRRYFAAAVGVVLELGLGAVNSWTKSKSPATTAVLYQGVHIVLQP